MRANLPQSGDADLQPLGAPFPAPHAVSGWILLSSRGAVVVVEHPTQTLSPRDCARVPPAARLRADDAVRQALMVSFLEIQLSNTTPILEISVKSAIPGIRGKAAKCGCMPVS